MLRMVSYSRRPQSGHIVCSINRTYHLLTTRDVWEIDVLQLEEYCSVQISAGGIYLLGGGSRRSHLVFCAGCGHNVSAGERFCQVCGKEVSVPAAMSPAVGAAGETSGKAIASLVCGLFLFAFPLSILAIIFGHLSVSEIRKSAGRLQGEGFAIAGLVLGYMGVAAMPVILIIAAIAIPNILRARIAANEASAAGSIRVLGAAEAGYAASHPDAGYTCALSDLADAGLIDSRLASGETRGYVFELSGCGPSAEGGANVKYRVVAYPLTRNTTGTRAFCADESGVVNTDEKGSPQDCGEK
jgi:type IV pilus assembly protein PilA